MKPKKLICFLTVMLLLLITISGVEAESVTRNANSENSNGTITTKLNVSRSYKDKKIAISGDKIGVSFNAPEGGNISVTGSVKIGNESVQFAEKENNQYLAEATVTNLEDGKEIPIDCSGVTVTQDKEYKLSNPTETVIYYSPLVFTDVNITNTNADKNTIIDGDTLEFSFKTNHPLLLDGKYEIQIGNKNVEVKSETGNKYVAKYTVGADDFDKETVLNLDPKLDVVDVYGNKGTVNFEKTGFSYFKPINKVISNFKVTTDSNNKDDSGVALIKKGNIITFSFDATRKVNIKEATIGDQKLKFTSDANNHYTATYEADDYLIDNENIKFNIIFNDNVGYKDFVLKDEDGDPVRFYSDIKVSEVSYSSNNANSQDIAKNGDTITLSFKTNHPTEITNGKIGTDDVKIETPNKMTYKISAVVVDGMTVDLGNILYEALISDKAENTPFHLKGDKSITYYAPIKISDLSLTSSNQKNNKTLCKNGDSIKVSVQANHNVTGTGSICSTTSEIANNDKNVSMSIQVTDNIIADQSAVPFTLKLSDVAGNESSELNQGNVGNQMIYYAPLNGNVTLTASGGKTPGYICNGGVVNANFPTQHNAAITSALISGTGASVAGNNATLVFDGNYIPEGNVTYQLSKEDAAGNTLAREGTENIIYDRTPPSIKINPQLAGFSNGNVNVDVTVDDANIDAGDMHFIVNNSDQSGGGSLSNTTYLKRITLSDENDYSLNLSSTDKAGNSSDLNGGRIIIDKTNPKITAINIDLEKVAVYKAGFVLSKHFNFADKYIKTVSCLLTEKTGFGGTSNWNINDPINDEGLKTAEITSTDMAENKSDIVRYSFYIDATAPKFVLKSNDGTTIKENRSVEIKPGTNINVLLEKIWMGDEKPDHFTELVLKDKNGATVESFIKAGDSQSHEKKVTLNKQGEYTLNCKAIDDVKNETKTIQYRFNVKKDAKPLVEQEARNTLNQGFILGGAALVVSGIIGSIIFILLKKKGQNK